MASLVVLNGCATANLNKMAITSMAATLPKGPGIAPGQKSQLLVSMTRPDGKVLKTKGGYKKIGWNDLTVNATVVKADKKGNVSLPADPRISDGKLPHVIITAPSHPGLRAELDIPLRYDRNFSAHFQGSSGSSGFDGTSGIDGTSGSFGSIDPENPVAGGDGTNGTNGSDGSDGEPGEDGPPVRVLATLKNEDSPLLQVSVSAEGRETFFLVDPQGGSLSVTSEGGAGGSGGRGGRGGRGGSGGTGSPNGRDGSNGSDGRDGYSGSSGSGGNITVIYNPRAKPFLGTIHLSNPGGPSPTFKEQPVEALW